MQNVNISNQKTKMTNFLLVAFLLTLPTVNLPIISGNPRLVSLVLNLSFSPYGMVDAVERPRDQTTGMAKGFAFITFKDPAVVETIVGQRWLTLPNGARIECKDWLFIILGF